MMYASDGLFEDIFDEPKQDYGNELSTEEYVDGIRENLVPSQLNSFNDATVCPLQSCLLTQSQYSNRQCESKNGLMDPCDETPLFHTIMSNSNSGKNSTYALSSGSFLEEVTPPFRISPVDAFAGIITSFHNNCILIN